MNIFKNFTAPRRKDSSGPLTGRILAVRPEFAQGLRVEEVIGQGGFATIYRVVDIVTGTVYALKHCVLNGNPDIERDLQTEIAVMRALAKCPEALTLNAAEISRDGEALLLLDYCEETLATHISSRSSTGLTNSEVISIFLPVAKAVREMHLGLVPPMAHRDVKAENVLRRPNGAWVLCDFGSSVAEQKVYSNATEISKEEERIQKHTTPAYRAPELWDLYTKEFIGLAVDIWSLGCLLYLLAYNKLPFDGEAKLQILNGSYRLGPGRPAELEALISSMLQVNPRDRPSAEQVVQAAEALFQNGGRKIEPHGNPAEELAFEDWGDEFARVARQRSLDSNLKQTDLNHQAQSRISASGSRAEMAMHEDWATFPAPPPPPPLQGQSQPGTKLSTSTNSITSEDELREHCKVLEQILETRNKDVDTLRQQNMELQSKVKLLEELERVYKQHITDLEKRLSLRDDKDKDKDKKKDKKKESDNGLDTRSKGDPFKQPVAEEKRQDADLKRIASPLVLQDRSSHLPHGRSRSSDLDMRPRAIKSHQTGSGIGMKPMRSSSRVVASNDSSPMKNSSAVHATRAGIVEPKETFFSDLDPLG